MLWPSSNIWALQQTSTRITTYSVSIRITILIMGCFNKNKENKDTAENTVGPELLKVPSHSLHPSCFSNMTIADWLKVLPQTELPWYRTKHLVLLNLMLLVPLLSSSAVGYDGQSLPTCLITMHQLTRHPW